MTTKIDLSNLTPEQLLTLQFGSATPGRYVKVGDDPASEKLISFHYGPSDEPKTMEQRAARYAGSAHAASNFAFDKADGPDTRRGPA